MSCDIAHDWGDLQHLHRMGQPVMREPERRKSSLTRRAHLLDHLPDALSEVEPLGKLRIDKQTDFHDGLSPQIAARRLLWLYDIRPGSRSTAYWQDRSAVSLLCGLDADALAV